MAIPVNVSELINQRIVESTRIEYKENFNPEAILRTICAFANDIDNIGGGYIVVGVEEENGSPKYPIKGVDKDSIDGILKKLREYCHYIEPLYEPIVEPVLYEGVYVIIIWVPGGYGRPYKAPKKINEKQSIKYYYIRKFSSSVIASPEEEKELFYASTNIPFDDRPNLAAEVKDLDLGIIREHLKQIGSSLYDKIDNIGLKELSEDLQIIGGPPEHLKPLNVGILMFSEHPERYFRYARIEVVDIPDPTGTNMTEKIFTGPIQRQLRDALAYIKNYIIKEVTIKLNDKAEAVRIANYPYRAIEEILANAVYHRSYQVNEPITVRITPLQIEITSFPGFDRSISDNDIENGNIRARIYRNRRIGDFLKELKLIEGRNTGFPNASAALMENGSQKLEFKMNEHRDYLSVIIPIHEYFKPENKIEDEYEQKLLNILAKNTMSLTELAHAMGYKGITAKLRKKVNEMIEQRKIYIILGENNKPQISIRR